MTQHLRRSLLAPLSLLIAGWSMPLVAQTALTQPNTPAYFVAEFEVSDPKGLQPYRERVESTFKPFGGRFLVRGGPVKALEGDAVKGRIVVIAFDSMSKAQAWYDSPAYRAIRPIRQRSAATRAYIVEGTAR